MRPPWFVLCLALACAPKPADDGSGSDGSGETGGTGAAAGTEGVSSATGGMASATEPTSGSAEAGQTVTGSPTDLEEACIAFCQVFDTCDPSPPGECVADCLDSIVDRCEALGAEYFMCLAGLTCEQIDGEAGPCAELSLMLDEMDCFKVCTVGVGGGEDTESGLSCSMETRCPDEPVQRVDCDPDGCTCFLDDVAVKTCPEGTCVDGAPSVDCCEGA